MNSALKRKPLGAVRVEDSKKNRNESQNRRLEKMNAELRKHNLCELRHTGTWQRGEFELLDIVEVWANRFYVIVQFSCLRPDGNHGAYFMKFAIDGAERRGCIMLALLRDEKTEEEYLAFTRQHRATLLVRESEPDEKETAWQTEVARHWSTSQRNASITDRQLRGTVPTDATSNPGKVLGQELMPLLIPGKTTLERFIQLAGNIPEDTGMSACLNDIWLAEILAHDMEHVLREVRGSPIIGIRIHPLAEVIRNRAKLGITDQHSCTALLLLWEHLNAINI